MNPARILIVDDHPIVRQGLRELLGRESDLCVAGEAGGADEAIAALEEGPFEAVIVELSLQGRSGLDLIRQISGLRPGLPVLVLTMHDEIFYAERALRAGARGYVMKQAPIERITAALRQVLGGGVAVSEQVAGRILAEIVGQSRPHPDAPAARLSNRELEVFRLIGQGRSTREAADALHVSVKTVESYRAAIKEKLGLRTAGELVRAAVSWVNDAAS